MCIQRHVKYLLFLQILINFNFLNIFSKNTQISNFMKIRLVGAELYHAVRRTERQTDGQTLQT
jgi:hypothetical protein